MFRNIFHSFSIRAVRCDQKLLVITDHTCQNRFHTEGSASLHENRCILFLVYMGKSEQLLTDPLGNLLIIIIPGAVIEHHLFFYRICRSQRSRCQ